MSPTDYPTALAEICARFELPPGDGFTQDWGREVPEAFRSADDLDRYVAGLLDYPPSSTHRTILMDLILDVANDLFSEGALSRASWEAVVRELSRDPELYAPLTERWALADEPLEDCFALTPLVRAVRGARNG